MLPRARPALTLPTSCADCASAPAGGSKGQAVKESKLTVSPSMEHMNLLASAASSRNVSSVELAAAAAAAETAPLLGHLGDAAGRRALPR